MHFVRIMFKSISPLRVQIISFDFNNFSKELNLDSGNLVT